MVNFDDYKTQIQSAIQQKIATGIISDPQGFILIDGFINISMQKELSGSLMIGGPTIPTVAVVGKSTGIMYTFALKVLLPNIPL